MKVRRLLALAAAIMLMVSGCGRSTENSGDAIKVVASTPIIADLVRQVAGERAEVTSLVPPGADPHSYELTTSQVRDIAWADIAFSNQLLLEDQALLNSIDKNLPDGVEHIGLGDASVAYGAQHIQLVEDASLSTIWLGMRVDGQSSSKDKVRISATEVEGPGRFSAFTTGTFGQPQVFIDSSNGINDEDGLWLPTNAHTHMSWGFSAPGEYRLGLKATLEGPQGSKELGSTTVKFVVGGNPGDLPGTVVNSGHMDITAHLKGGMSLYGDDPDGGRGTVSLEPEKVTVFVPHQVATKVPADQQWRFLGRAGEDTWILAQAVLGRHVHGEIDPHLWHDVHNAIAYVEVIRDKLSRLDPAGASTYQRNAEAYIQRLHTLDQWMSAVFASIPQRQRHLVTAHDAFGYLARGYGLSVGGFVVPNPSLEPSAKDLSNLTRTLKDLGAPAVFLEPTSQTHAGELINAAQSTGVKVCDIYADTFAGPVNSYWSLMVTNTRNIKACLDPDSLPAWPVENPAPVLKQQTKEKK